AAVKRPVGREGFEQAHEVRRTISLDPTLEFIRRKGERDQNGVSAIADTIHATLFGVGITLSNGPALCVDEIRAHLAAALPECCLKMLLAVSGGSAIIHLQHRIT